MKYGFVFPGGSAQQQLELAKVADDSGWDAVFVWEASYGVDAWTLLAAMAQATSQVRLGTMLTPLPWRRPWKVASQVLTLDQVSNGRAILSVGLGAVSPELGTTNEVLDRRTRAEMMDEGIDIIRGLWEGKLDFAGKHYTMDLAGRQDLAGAAQAVQQRIPIWCVGAWPSKKSMRRILRCDGLLPNIVGGGPGVEITPEMVRDMKTWLLDNGARPDIDLVMEGETPPDDAAAAHDTVAPIAEAGATWWLESRWVLPHHSAERMQQVNDRLKAGPPRV